MHSFRVTISVAVVWIGFVSLSWAAPCAVPTGSYPTIQSAVDDPGCSDINLQSQVYEEVLAVGRSLAINGVTTASTVIIGQVRAEGAATVVALVNLTVDGSAPTVAGCFKEAAVADGGAQLIGSNLSVRNGDGIGCLLFGDDFEDGSTSAWSASAP